jgi:hypothetical protein
LRFQTSFGGRLPRFFMHQFFHALDLLNDLSETAHDLRIGFRFSYGNSDGCERHTPSEIDGDAHAAQADDVLPYDLSVDVATHVTQMSKLGKIQLQRAVAMDEISHAISDKLQRRGDSYSKRRRRGISALTLISLAATTAFARLSSMAMRVKGANTTRVPQHAWRNQYGLMHSINGYQWLGHTYPHAVKQVAGRCCEAGAAPG